MDIADLEAEAAELVLPDFDEGTAWRLGQSLVALALADALPVVIDIRTPDRTLFHAALPGSAPVNDLWALRKSRTAFLFQKPSLLVGRRLQAKSETVAKHGLDPADHAVEGGAVPIRVRAAGVVAIVTVSGLTQVEDHFLAVRGLRTLL